MNTIPQVIFQMRFGPIPKHKTDKELLNYFADMIVEAMCGDDSVPVDIVDERTALYDLVCALDPVVPVDTENANATDTLIRDLVEEARAILCTPPVPQQTNNGLMRDKTMFVECKVNGIKFRATTDFEASSPDGQNECQQIACRDNLFHLLKEIVDSYFSCSSKEPVQSPWKIPATADTDYGARFFVVDLGDGKRDATRSKIRSSDGVPLTRRILYRGRMEQAECEYAHSFMCCGFPTCPDSNRPTKDEWLDKEPFEFEVDKFVSEKLFG